MSKASKRGRPRQKWTVTKVLELLHQSNGVLPVRELKRRMHADRYPQEWNKLLTELRANVGFNGKVGNRFLITVKDGKQCLVKTGT